MRIPTFLDPNVGDVQMTSALLLQILATGSSQNTWIVNSATGNDNNSGQAVDEAFKSISEAASRVQAGGTIYIQGSFNEAVNIAQPGVSLIGAGSTSNRALWTAPDTVAPCLTVSAAADVVASNLRFRPPLGNSAISLVGASNQFLLDGCRIQGKTGSYNGILTDGGQSNVKLTDNEFFYINTAATHGHAILGSGYVTAEPVGWIIEGNIFSSNTYHIVCRMSRSTIINNVFAGIGLTAVPSSAAPSMGIDISGATVSGAGCNIVSKNVLGGAYTTALYVSGTNDDWTGNYSLSNAGTCVNGITLAVPTT